jgi:hypothetical protein
MRQRKDRTCDLPLCSTDTLSYLIMSMQNQNVILQNDRMKTLTDTISVSLQTRWKMSMVKSSKVVYRLLDTENLG